MTQITRVYDTSNAATEALTELTARGFRDFAVVRSAPNHGGQSNGADIHGEIRKTGVSRNFVEAYADRVKRGGAVVSVNAPFGAAAAATEILERHSPAPELTESSSAPSRGSEHGAWRLSKALGLPELAPSDFFLTGLIPLLVESKSFATLSRNQNGRARLSSNQNGHARLSNNQNGHAQLSKHQRGWATLSNNPTPFSSALGLPVLAEDRYKAGWRREPV